MAERGSYRTLGDITIDDPAEVASVNQLEADADLELVRRDRRRNRRPPAEESFMCG